MSASIMTRGWGPVAMALAMCLLGCPRDSVESPPEGSVSCAVGTPARCTAAGNAVESCVQWPEGETVWTSTTACSEPTPACAVTGGVAACVECRSSADCSAKGSAYSCVGSACVCTPQCEGRNCGDNACGGTCGTCADGNSCGDAGQCLCAGGGAACGDDCCAGGQVCDLSASPPACCSPDCAGLACGDDSCGGVCGYCTAPQSCDPTGSCALPAGVFDTGTFDESVWEP